MEQKQSKLRAATEKKSRRAAKNPPAAGRKKGSPLRKLQSKKKYTSRRKNHEKAVPIKIYPLGGLGEIGKNLTVYECNDDMIIVDCGSSFPESDMYGIDLVIPDFTFLEENQDKLLGIIITHGHEDHIGALPYLLRQMDLPIYATRLTMGLIENKLEEHGLRSSAKLHQITPRKKFSLGCFDIDPIHVNHSIPDSVSFAIASPAGVVIHTGDWKVDYTPVGGQAMDLSAFSEYGDQGVLALLSDSTNSERAGHSSSESTVNNGLAALFGRAGKKRVIVATFASNLYRVQLLVDLAVKHGRKVAISGRSMVNNTEMAIELGYLRAPEGVFIDIEKVDKYPPEEVTIITTGSQGEAMSALSRMASGNHRNVHVGCGDFIIISATPIPGNEKMVTRVINGLLRLGAEVIYENMYDVHASGHACQDEQKLMLSLTKPQFFIPIHGEYKHLKKHADTAEKMGISEENIVIADTGDVIVLSKKGAATDGTVQAGAILVDGLGVGDVGSVVLRDRRLLSEDGIVVIAVTLDKVTGELLCGPEIFTRGFVYVRDSEKLLEETRQAIEKVLTGGVVKNARQDAASAKTLLKETASGLLYRRTKRSPMILPIVQEV